MVREEGSSKGEPAPQNPVQGEGEWCQLTHRLQPSSGLFLRELPEVACSPRPVSKTLISFLSPHLLPSSLPSRILRYLCSEERVDEAWHTSA